MNRSPGNTERGELENARLMRNWVRRYAQNRSLPVAVNLMVFAMLSLAVAFPSYWGGMAYRDGNDWLSTICLGVLIVALGATVYFSVPPWGGRRLQQAAEVLYSREGRVTIARPNSARTRIGNALGVGFLVCVTGNVLLGLLGYLPAGKYMQPISAIYCVPFLVALTLLLRPATGYIPLLWPVLYALHAVLIVAGAPIVFIGPWESLNILVPIAGYGLLTSLVGHLFSRWALHKVRVLAGANRELAGEGE